MKELNSNNCKEDAFLNEQWIEHFFIVSLQKPRDKNQEFLNYLHAEVHSKILSFLVIPSSTVTYGKSVSTASYFRKDLPTEYEKILQIYPNENSYFTLIRFPDARKEDLEKATFRYIQSSEKRNYKFSPIQSIEFLKVSKRIEWTLHILTGIKPYKSMILITSIDDEVIIYEFDGLQYLSYPLSKRAELYSKYPELNMKMFNMDFKKFTNWIIDKENDDETMKHNVDLTRKILKRFD